jgi:hypothetical protein
LTLANNATLTLAGAQLLFAGTHGRNRDGERRGHGQPVGTNPNTGDPIMEVGVITTGAKQFIRLDVTSP